ncbi:MAG: serine O-acetyltransferase [Rhodospirillaceae bacterium]|jgi:serine O-acetyltransferase|nr:serine O-acetyltransferase [Rhodospirillaceae bacterium]MBT5241172.1 serine O-acetyltransferase [Rhodospirillaceae bacterium]MBT5565684.1 serine O-acetyltransferase [Rhodospirillaceae bacterium]MBT6088215.1 serine O-acetyltransferase [Rhodospirillaceae bacterium]MBT6961250.1 serine O-acetyltransferase [Rhodospirillaceae bacterium]
MSSILETLRSIQKRDPAARSLVQIALLYPGVRALAFHRAANFLWRHGLHFLGRLVSEIGRFLSGVEIHPAATIGERLFIDHGHGVVIGETARIGNDVTLYHGVTLGGLSPHDGVGGCRHPTILDRAVIGAGAQVLGPITVHECARVGANAVVTKDVPRGAMAVGIPARVVNAPDNSGDDAFEPYGVTRGDLPDPTAKVIEGLMSEIAALQKRVTAFETEADRPMTSAAALADETSDDALSADIQ